MSPEDWHIEFNPLWNASEREVAEVEKLKADTTATKAQAAMGLLQMAALDPTEIRNTLKASGGFEIDDSLDQKLLTAINMGGE